MIKLKINIKKLIIKKGKYIDCIEQYRWSELE